MKVLHYQLKSVLRDKFCLMTFLLPILVAAALHFTGSINFSALGEFHFGVLADQVPAQTVTWLERYGPVSAYATQEELYAAIREPSTNVIGVEACQSGIKTTISGDELDLYRQTAATLPALYEQQGMASAVPFQILKRPDVTAGFQDMLIAVTLIAAMFMGCTFNAMSMISEKEDGVAFINEILPMTSSQYILQKLGVGFICGSLSSILTAGICYRLSWQNGALMLGVILLSTFAAALIGLFVGRFSSGLMVGVIYIKMIMLIFIAVPILCFLTNITHPLLVAVCHLVPSQAAFTGIMALSTGSMDMAAKEIFVLLIHCVAWFLLYAGLVVHRKK